MHKKPLVCPDCQGPKDNPMPYWTSSKLEQEEFYCTNPFHDATSRLLELLAQGILPPTS